MSSASFIEEFTNSMKRLTDIKQNIQSNMEFKDKFTSSLKDSLSNINNKLQNLSGKIKQLSENANELKNKVASNSSSISEKDKQIETLKQQMTQLQQQYEGSSSSSSQQKQELENKINEQQKTIDDAESKLRQIQTELSNITNQKNALEQEVKSKGDMSSQHAEQINMLTEESKSRLLQQQNELTSKITDCENKIQKYEQQLKDKDQTIQTEKQNIISTSQSLQQTIDSLTQEKNALSQENDQLIGRIMEATQAINDAATALEYISAGVPNAQTQQEVNTLLQQIEHSFENIGRALQSQPQTQQNITPDTIIQITDYLGQNIEVKYNDILKMLVEKSKKDGEQFDKYRKALAEIRNSPIAGVNRILQSNNIQYKNNIIMGGRRKTKKNKKNKQKGGFTYKSTYRRKSISSVSKSSRKSSRSTKQRHK
jgi:chromosome segregation ATPase